MMIGKWQTRDGKERIISHRRLDDRWCQSVSTIDDSRLPSAVCCFPFAVCRLKFRVLRCTRKGNHIADVAHAGYKLHHAFKTQPKAGVGHGTKAAGI